MRIGDAVNVWVSVDINDEAVGVGQKKGGILLDVVDIEDDAREVRRDLCGTDAGKEAAFSDGETFAGEFRREMRVVEIEINAVGVLDAGGFELDLVAKVDGNTGVGGGRPVADAGDERSGRGGGDRLEMRCGLGMRERATDASERSSEEDAAERVCTAGAHADNSLGLRAAWEMLIERRVFSRVPVQPCETKAKALNAKDAKFKRNVRNGKQRQKQKL